MVKKGDEESSIPFIFLCIMIFLIGIFFGTFIPKDLKPYAQVWVYPDDLPLKYKVDGKVTASNSGYVLNYGENIDQQKLLKNKVDIKHKIDELEFELFFLKQSLSVVEMDLKAINNGMRFEYKKVPNSTFVMRVEYDPSIFENVTIQE